MGLTVHFEVLNQLGTPMLYSSTLATRPAAGITGRIFYRTDSPFGIYRDNGVTWDLISSVGSSGAVTGTGVATRVAYWDTTSSISSDAGLYFDVTNDRLGIGTITPGSALDAHQTSGTIIQANATALGNSLQSFQLQGTGKWQIGNVYNAGANYFRVYDQLNSIERIKQQNTGELDQTGWIVNTNTVTGITGTVTTQVPNSSFSNNFTFNSGISTVAQLNTIGIISDNNLNYSGANTINSTSYNAAGVLRTNMTFGAAASTITYTQATGIRALANKQSIYIQSGGNSGTISHYANLQIFGDQKLGAGTTTFTNRYQILLNDYAEFAAGNTYTNRWAIYQDGSSNTNYFAGKILTGTSTVSTYQLSVVGTTSLAGIMFLNTIDFDATTATKLIIGNTGNLRTISIGGSATSQNFAVAIGFRSSTANEYATSIGCDAQSTGTSAVAIGWGTIAAANEFVVGSAVGSVITNVYFGSGKNRGMGGGGSTNAAGTSYAINGSGALGTDFGGGNLTLAGGKGTGTGTPGDVIFSTSTALTTGATVQTLTQRWFVKGGSGILSNTSSVNSSAILQMTSTTQGFLPPVMTLTQRNAISTPASGLLVINTTDATLDGYDGTAAAWYQSVRSDNGYVKVNATTSGTTGAASGQYLQINVNGTSYKLLLLNP